jgi:hypothetical protein
MHRDRGRTLSAQRAEPSITLVRKALLSWHFPGR